MPFASLGEFVAALRKAGELHEVGASVDPHFEIGEITDRVVKAGGPALLFTDVRGSHFPVLTNQFGTQRRMAMALDANDLDEVGDRIRTLIDVVPPAGSLVGKAARRVAACAARECDPAASAGRPAHRTWCTTDPTSPSCPCSRRGRSTPARSSRCRS